VREREGKGGGSGKVGNGEGNREVEMGGKVKEGRLGMKGGEEGGRGRGVGGKGGGGGVIKLEEVLRAEGGEGGAGLENKGKERSRWGRIGRGTNGGG